MSNDWPSPLASQRSTSLPSKRPSRWRWRGVLVVVLVGAAMLTMALHG